MKWKRVMAFMLSAMLTVNVCTPLDGVLRINVSAADTADVIVSEEEPAGEELLTEEAANSSMDESTFDGSSGETLMESGSDEIAGTGETGEYAVEQEPMDDSTMPETEVSEEISPETEDPGSDSYDEAEMSEADSFDTSSPAEEEPVLDDETTEADSSVSDEETASEDSSVSEDGTSGDVESPDASEVSDIPGISETSDDSETAQEGAEGAEAADDQNVVREFEDDVIVGFDEPGEADTINLEYKISLPALREMFPKQLVIWLGGTVHYEEGEDGALIPVNAEGYTAQNIDVEWSCVENYDESLELFHFVPVLEGYTLAEGIVLPEITVQVEGEFEAPPLTEYEKTAYDDFEVPIIGSVGVDGRPIRRGTLPARYDAYAENSLPPVRDQGDYGTCWAHGTIGSIEADLIADGNAGTDIDLSELHLAYFMSNEFYDEKNCNVGDTITTAGSFLKGGDERTACNLLTGMVGPALETDAPYSLGDNYDPDPWYGRGLGTAQLSGVYEINSMDLDAVKNAILVHGGVDASYCEDDSFYSPTYNSYYDPEKHEANHAVMLVGWDDSFPRTSFIAGTPEKNGAWLVRNSWGYDGYDHTGYFWMSYYDKSLYESVLAMDVQTSRYDHCYAYDSIPFVETYSTDEGVMSGTQVFTVDEQEQIQAVGIQTLEPMLDIDISLKCGNRSASARTSTGYPGYYLITLNKPLTVARRSEVTLTVTYSGDGKVTMPVEVETDVDYTESVYHPNCGSGGLILSVDDESINTGKDGCFRLFTMDDTNVSINISELDIRLSPTSYVYNGTAKKPAVTVKDGSYLLEEGVDYSLDYRNNVNSGTASVILTGAGDYTGSVTKTFKINKAAQNITVKAAASSVAVGKTTTVSISGARGTKSFKSSNTAIATINSAGKVTAKKVGRVTITAASAAAANYNAASKTVTINVVPAAISSYTAGNAATGVWLKWKNVAGANGYKVYRGSTLIKTIKNTTALTCSDTKANTNGARYIYKIVPTSAYGDGAAKTITMYRVAKIAVTSVKNSGPRKMTVRWGRNPRGSGYQIQYSTSKSFSYGNKIVNISNAAAVSTVIRNLTKRKYYYVRIRTYKNINGLRYWSLWSAAKSVKITR